MYIYIACVSCSERRKRGGQPHRPTPRAAGTGSICRRQQTLADVSIRQHTSAYGMTPPDRARRGHK